MFIHLLTDMEKKVLMDLLMRLANIDNTFDRKEMDYVLSIHLKHEIPMHTDPKMSVKRLCAHIEKEQSCIIVLQEMLRLARIDGEFRSIEEGLIDEVAKHFKVGPDKFLEIDRWVKNGLIWLSNGDAIISSLSTVQVNRY